MQENTVFETVEVETVECEECGREVAIGDTTEHEGSTYCNNCFNEIITVCTECRRFVLKSDTEKDGVDNPYCETCFDSLFITCDGCSYVMREADAYEVDGCHYCKDCFDEGFTTCTNCRENIRKDEAHTVDGDDYCEDCFYESFSYCDRCNEPVSNNDGVMLNDSIYCDHCIEMVATRCEDCGEWVSETVTTVENNEICYHCYENDYFTCEECGNIYHTDHYGDDGHCTFCHEDNDGAIMDYGTTPDLCFHHVNNEERLAFMGVELEIDEGGEDNDNARAIAGCFDDNQVYFNHDGSLNRGFEIISHPFTLGYYRETLSTNYASAMTKASEMGYKSHDTTTCGLHVHVSRLAFGDDAEAQDATLGKLWYITKKFWPELVRFSRRKAEHLNRWAAPLDDVADEVAEHDDAATIGKKVKEKGENGRYRAINTLNRATIEFRLFRGTLNHRTFTATIELVHALVTMARRMSFEGLKEVNTFRDLIEAAHSGNVGGYKALYEYAYEKKFFAVA